MVFPKARIEVRILMSGAALPSIYLWIPFNVLDLKREIQRLVGLKTTRQRLLRENCATILDNNYTFYDFSPCIRVGLCLLALDASDCFPSFQWDYAGNPLHGNWGRTSSTEVRIAKDSLTGRLGFATPATVPGSVWHGWLEPDTFDDNILMWNAPLSLLGPGEKPWYGPGGGRALPPIIEGNARVGWYGAHDALVLTLFNDDQTILHRDLSKGNIKPTNVVPMYEEWLSKTQPLTKVKGHRLSFRHRRVTPQKIWKWWPLSDP